MARIGYHASHEQFTPRDLLDHVRRAEQAGFQAAMCSDHFHPWSDQQGQSGHAWSWLGAAMATTRLPFGVVNAPGARYHPAVVAQAVATLSQMFDGRFWIAVGSGEAINESITGAVWPAKDVRNRRLRECVDVMRALWSGECVTHRGEVVVEEARLYTRPAAMPQVFVAALSEETARWAAPWADGLITISQPHDTLRPIIDAFREHGGEAKPVRLQVKLAYAQTDEAARQGAWEQWRTNVFGEGVPSDLRTPADYEAAACFVRPEDVERKVRVSSDPARQAAWLHEDLQLGFDELQLHNVHREQARFIDDFGARVLPALR
ncbi:MAG: Similar to F420-dependent glucose-6-phosphate dehydrogenase, Mext_1273 family [uncultured Lysobacter sp.]|uniref:Similar to F420-dependent glucose-6-phosphate dehydrogenase, Mext_1273 family n=1 Tax=uncultured Lysobacter sp. TaxID=271060 RepID=A0A6J4KLJ5_9GAMM|nr:MAG: Similar to F420-dependent glucose-6-phosphate dehydrogenase, Mext_1273 family [uncultured Lysobacter sp.]